MVYGKSKLVLVASAVALLVVSPPPCSSQTNQSSQSAKQADAKEIASFAGCYDLKMGRWWPWGFGEDDEFVTPPGKIQLLTERGTEGFETGKLLIREIPIETVEAGGRRRYSYWQVKSEKRADLI